MFAEPSPLQGRAFSGYFLLIGAALLLSAVPSGAQRPANLLLNGGFEWGDGGITGQQSGVGRAWETICGGSHPEIYSLDASVRHSGRFSQRMGSTGYHERWTDSGVYCFQPLQDENEARHPAPVSLGLQALAQTTRPGLISPGRTYECSAWVRIADVKDSWEWFRLGVYWLDDAGMFISESRQPEDPDGTGTHDWKQVKVTAAAPPRAAFAKVYLHHHFVSGEVWFDDVRLTECPAPAPEHPARRAQSGRAR